MRNEKFLALVKSHANLLNRAREEQAVDWEKRKVWWISQVDKLMWEVRGWLKVLEDEGVLTVQMKKIQIVEQELGSYEVDAMTITIGYKSLVLKPVASVVVGGFGRVDIEGPGGSVMLLLILPAHLQTSDPMNEVKWFISSMRDRGGLRDFDEDNFQSVFSTLLLINDEE